MYRIIGIHIFLAFIVFYINNFNIYAQSAHSNKTKSASKETLDQLNEKSKLKIKFQKKSMPVTKSTAKKKKNSKLYATPIHSRTQKPASDNRVNYKDKKNSAFVHYHIKKGDTIFKIAKKFKINVNDIYLINNLTKQYVLMPHTLLLIPKKKLEKKLIIYDKFVKKNSNIENNNIIQTKNTVDKEKINITTNFYENKFLWPLTDVLSFSNDSYNGVKPIGLIIKGRSGGKILSSAPGIVKKIGYMRGFGNYIVLVHADRFSTVYSRVGKVLVGEGESIHAGVTIGIIDKNTDILHFQIDYEGKPADPLKFLPHRSRF